MNTRDPEYVTPAEACWIAVALICVFSAGAFAGWVAYRLTASDPRAEWPAACVGLTAASDCIATAQALSGPQQ